MDDGLLIREDIAPGAKCGSWEVLRKSDRRANGRVCWVCRCSCGVVRAVRGRDLKNGKSTGCGCVRNAQARQAMTTHGKSNTRTHQSWLMMLERCNNKSFPKYPSYGGRGIKVCARWQKFENFLADMGERPEGKTLDRYPNNDGNYEPGNCRWATVREQNINRRWAVKLTLNGVTKPMAVWADELGFDYSCLQYRRSVGWSDERILTTPSARSA